MGGIKAFNLLNVVPGITDHNYFQKEKYLSVFLSIWKNLKSQKVVTYDFPRFSKSNLPRIL